MVCVCWYPIIGIAVALFAVYLGYPLSCGMVPNEEAPFLLVTRHWTSMRDVRLILSVDRKVTHWNGSDGPQLRVSGIEGLRQVFCDYGDTLYSQDRCGVTIPTHQWFCTRTHNGKDISVQVHCDEARVFDTDSGRWVKNVRYLYPETCYAVATPTTGVFTMLFHISLFVLVFVIYLPLP